MGGRRESFESIEGYEVRPGLVQAKSYGVPQNRPRGPPRVGIRKDLGWSPDETLIADGLLPQPDGKAPDPFLGDLVDAAYLRKSATTTYPSEAETPSQTWYRLSRDGESVATKGDPLTDHEYSRHDPRIVAKFTYMLQNNGAIRAEDQTKKFAQRVIPEQWGDGGPMVTATSLPDDYIPTSYSRAS